MRVKLFLDVTVPDLYIGLSSLLSVISFCYFLTNENNYKAFRLHVVLQPPDNVCGVRAGYNISDHASD